MSMDFVCAIHGHCFDGLASAVVFTRLLNSVEPQARLNYIACGYGPNQKKPDASVLTGEENAILDYRYYDVPRLTWYFDHHKTAFANGTDEAAFRRRAELAPGRFVVDMESSSCTKLIAQIAAEQHGLDLQSLQPLIAWADIVDAARFPSAEAAVDMSNPLLQLASVVEHFGDDKFTAKLVKPLLEQPLEEVARSRLVRQRYEKLGPRHERFQKRVRQRGRRVGRVVHVDLTEEPVDAVAKFTTYAAYPEAVYSVVVSLLSAAVKISLGYNPWCGVERDVDLHRICARWGGGGHPVVGGISFPKSEVERARAIALQIVDELASPDGPTSPASPDV